MKETRSGEEKTQEKLFENLREMGLEGFGRRGTQGSE